MLAGDLGDEGFGGAVDRDGRAAQWPQLLDDVADGQPGASLHLPGDRQGGEHYLQATTGASLKKIITTLRPLQDATIRIAGQCLTAAPELTTEAHAIPEKLTH